MSLNTLPAELTAWIVLYLPELTSAVIPGHQSSTRSNKKGLSRYAGSSIELQHAIECRLFSTLTLTSDDLETFDKLVSETYSQRKALLQEMTFTPVLPTYDDQACARYERPADHKRNNEAYQAAVRRLLTSLRRCDDTKDGSPIHLSLRAPHAPTDLHYRDRETLRAHQRAVAMGERRDLFDQRFAHAYICFDLSDDVSAVTRVEQFVALGDGARYVDPSSIFALLKKLPCVEDLMLQLYDEERKSPELRKRLRIDFAKALCTGQSVVLKKFRLFYQHEAPIDQRFTNADVRGVSDDSGSDDFSIGLGRFLSGCRQLSKVHLGGPICIDEAFFWPPTPSENNDQWANLQELSIHMSSVRPDGGWYLERHPDFALEEPVRTYSAWETDEEDSSDDDDAIYSEPISSSRKGDFFAQDELPPDSYDQHREGLRTGGAYHSCFRTQPNEALERVLAAAAKTAANMPSLRSLSIKLNIDGCPRTNGDSEEFELSYHTRGSRNPDLQTGIPNLQWCVSREWKMSEDLEVLWRRVLGSSGEITYDNW
jgi:hypothetical protein